MNKLKQTKSISQSNNTSVIDKTILHNLYVHAENTTDKKSIAGITLVALVVTIIILLILVGVTIATLTGEGGLLKNASNAKEKAVKAQLKEEIEMAIMDIQAEEIGKGNNVILETLVSEPNKLLENRLEGITAILNNNEITGEYKGYEYKIDEKLKVSIEDKVQGISFSYTLKPTGYTNGSVIITIETSSTNGEITSIEAPDGLTKNEDGTYTVIQNGDYEFTVTDSTGTIKTKRIIIKTIDQVEPKDFTPSISEVKTNGFTIISNAEDGEETDESVKSGIGKYVYYFKKTTDSEYSAYESTEARYTISTLESGKTYNVYVIAYDRAGNSKRSSELTQTIKDEEIDYEGYINSHMQVDKKIYISSRYGNDSTGNGTQEKPYATLDKISEEGIIEKEYTYAIVLMNGTYQLTTNMFELDCNEEINIIGNKQNTTLNVGKIYGTSAGEGSKEYKVNLYRLIWNDISTTKTNIIMLNTSLELYNIYLNVRGSYTYGYFVIYNDLIMNNCTLPINTTNFLRSDWGSVRLTNCYGGFSSGYRTSDDSWNYRTNYITSIPQVNNTTYQITKDESIWRNVGTGTNPDGSQANLGVYGGEYSWEE